MSEQAAIIDDFKRLLEENASLTLTNVYKEVPIVHKGFIFEVKNDRLVLETNELQICAMHWSGSTVIRAETLTAPIEAQLESTDIRRNMVTLSGFRSTELPCEQRATVRVRLKKPVRLVITSQEAKIAGVIHDISIGGCLVRTGRSRPEIGQIMVDVELDGQPLTIPARVLRIEGEEPCYQCAIVFDHSQETEQIASTFIHKRELEIIKELQSTL